MGRVRVYRFKAYDGAMGDDRVAPRAATRNAITHANGTVIEDKTIEVDESELDGNHFLRDPFEGATRPCRASGCFGTQSYSVKDRAQSPT